MSANDYYTATGTPGTQAPGASAPMRSEFTLIQEAFDLLPSLTAKAVIAVNSAGTALTATTVEIDSGGGVTIAGAIPSGNYAGAALKLTSGFMTTPLAGDNGGIWFTSDGISGPVLQAYEEGFCAFTTAVGAGVDFNFETSGVWGWGKGDDDDPLVAQTQKVQGRDGQLNAAGADWTFKASSSTGTGVGGGFVFRVTPAGSSGTTTNTFVDALIIDGSGNLTSIGFITTPLSGNDGGLFFSTDGLTGTVLQSTAEGEAAFTTAIGTGVDFNFAAANVWKWGKLDSGIPVAQTQGVQGATGANVAGADWTIQASASTGSANGGAINFQTTQAGGGGSTQNNFATAFSVYNGAAVLKSYTVATLPSASVCGAGAMAYVTDSNSTTFNATVAGLGSNKIKVTSDGVDWKIG